MPSVLQTWVEGMPIRMQSTLLLGLRGPDSPTPMPHVKAIGRWLRGLTFKPGNPDNVREFMEAKLPERIVEKGPTAKELEFCSQHYYSHLMHALEVVGYMYPYSEGKIGLHALGLYRDMCRLMHLPMENLDDFEQRLCTRDWPGGRQPDTVHDALQLLGDL